MFFQNSEDTFVIQWKINLKKKTITNNFMY